MDRVFTTVRTPPQRSWKAIAGWSLLALITALVVVIALLEPEHSLRRGVERLSVDDQATALQRAVDELSTTCAHPSTAGLHSHCREEADFALSFPDCDQTCQKLARSQLAPAPAR